MKRYVKRGALTAVLLTLLIPILFVPGLPWSARNHHLLGKLAVRADVKMAKWRGAQPRLSTIRGTLKASDTLDEVLGGARIEAIDSASGWATLTGPDGTFALPGVLWYPNGKYALIVSLGINNVRQIGATLPISLPEDGVISLGALYFDKGCPVDMEELQGANSIHQLTYDAENAQYWKGLFRELTRDKVSEEEKFGAINQYVANKLKCDGARRRTESPRETLEEGSCYCGALSLAFAAIGRAGNYKTRLLDLSDGATDPTTHMIVEVYYDEGWHAYDPALGVEFPDASGGLASYRELRLNPKLVEASLLRGQTRMTLHISGDSIPKVYQSGLHHFYSFERSALYTLW